MSNLKTKIMRRIYLIWMARKVFSPFMIKGYILVATAFAIGQLVWVDKVFMNSPRFTSFSGNLGFFLKAYINTEFSVQVLVALMVVSGAMITKDILVRNVFRFPGVIDFVRG